MLCGCETPFWWQSTFFHGHHGQFDESLYSHILMSTKIFAGDGALLKAGVMLKEVMPNVVVVPGLLSFQSTLKHPACTESFPTTSRLR